MNSGQSRSVFERRLRVTGRKMILDSMNTMISAATFGVCLFCAHLLFLRQRDPGVHLPLALLFLIQGVSNLLTVLAFGIDETDLTDPLMRISILFAALEFASPLLFWLYVRALTSEDDVQDPPRLRYHIVPIAIATACFWSLLFLPADIVDGEIAEDDPRIVGILLISLAVLIGDIVLKVMIATYLYLTIRRLIAYRQRLKDIFASTENRELNWIWMIIISAGIFMLLSIGASVATWVGVVNETDLSGDVANIESFAQLILFWVIGIWGLRQRPGLRREPMAAPAIPDEIPARKYEKSALDEERALRIAQKIETSMKDDMLYRDPNLSLWDLAKHISVTSHYVSQALNTHLNKSFFDLVNGWRIKDAIEQLNTTDETILVIAYDVGFNSRSAFYKAFKRETGKTPSDLRK